MSTSLIIIKVFACVAFTIGLFLAALDIFAVPDSKTQKNISYLSRNTRVKSGLYSRIVTQLADFIAKFIKIEPLKRTRLANEFETLEIRTTPEKYYANAIAKGLLIGVFAIPAFFIHFLASIILLMLTFVVFAREFNSIDRIISKRREDIDAELPRFVAVVEQTLKNDRDIVKMLTTYIGTNDSSLAKELKITIADMKTGDYELALGRLSNRNSSISLSEVARGLVSASRGEDTSGYFDALSVKLWDNERARIKKLALKMPAKVKYLVTTMLVCMFLIYIVVFGTVIMDSMGSLFGTF